MGSVAMDKSGNMGLGYSVSDGSSVFPGVRYTGRVVTDTLGTMPQGEITMVAGGGVQTRNSGGVGRWGDYSMMAVDPVDDCTFWYTQEFIPTTTFQTWHTI